ncbi:hypothetical protein HY031_02230 [Candidatus Gottesmanbacteria bacterium]|nr:hypothetical protein [Candidatus Gottesmanbacteria bacterium]
MAHIIPTLFSTNEDQFKGRVTTILASKRFRAGWVQLDIMDGIFVPRTGVGIDVIKKYPLEGYKKEAHLMVTDPSLYIPDLLVYGANRIIFPIEIDKDIAAFVQTIHNHGVFAGVSINPETDITAASPYGQVLDSILIMSSRPGREGQPLPQETYNRIREVKKKFPRVTVGVDEGVTDINARELALAGADYLAIGSFLFTGDFDTNFEKIQMAINP